MALFEKRNGGLMDVIRCDEPSYLIWKWHPKGTSEGNSTKENAIRWGSSLRVKDGEVAVFVYNTRNESAQEYIEGPADCILDTENLPIIAGLVGMAYAGGTPFQAEVYFVNLAQVIQHKFVVPYFDVFDPRFTDFAVPTAVRGTVTFRITDFEQFIKIHRLRTFTLEDFNNEVKDSVSRYVKGIVANAPSEYDIPVIQLERRIEDINVIVENSISKRFFDEFGVTVSSVDVAVIDIDKTSDGYNQLKSVTQDITADALKAQAEVNIKQMKANQKLDVFEKAGKIFSNFKEDTFARHEKTKTGIFETSAKSVIEKVGEINIPGLSKKEKGDEDKTTPPPIPTVSYYIAVNGQPEGPYEFNKFIEMKTAGIFGRNSLVWKEGMENWEKASEMDDFKKLFPNIPPIPKNDKKDD